MKASTRKGLFRLYLVGWGAWAVYLAWCLLWVRGLFEQSGFHPDAWSGCWEDDPYGLLSQNWALLSVFALAGALMPSMVLIALSWATRPWLDHG